jgi:hypothetical protein
MTERRSQVLAAGHGGSPGDRPFGSGVEAAPKARPLTRLVRRAPGPAGRGRDVILQADQATVTAVAGASRRDHQEVARDGRGPVGQRRLARRDVERRRGRSSLRRHDGALDDGRDGSGHRAPTRSWRARLRAWARSRAAAWAWR